MITIEMALPRCPSLFIYALCLFRIKDHEVQKKQEEQEMRKEAQEIERLRQLHLWEQAVTEQKKDEEKRNVMKAHRVRLSHTALTVQTD